MTTPTTRTLTLPGGLDVAIDEYGDPKSTGILILHGGGGPFTVAGFAATLAEQTYVIAPTLPGFEGTPRPDGFDSVADLASAYLDVIDVLGLTDVIVVGSSVGGWIAAEMAVRDNHESIAALVLANSAGIKPEPGQKVADVAVISPAELTKLSFHQPQFRPDPSTMTEERLATMAANQRTLAVYAGDPYMHDPKLKGRLHRVEMPVLVLWGEYDGVFPLEYGRMLAGSFPHSRFVPIPDAAHFPHIENPKAVSAALADFVDTEVTK